MAFLGDVADYRKDRINYEKLTPFNYVSTDSMLANKNGITQAVTMPEKGKLSAYFKNDILISNIRPYFKKIWLATKDGGCSNDVLVFSTSNSLINPQFLYYILFQDSFFSYMMSGSNGTKMPRGHKKSILKYQFELPPIMIQNKIATLLSNYDNLIQNNTKRIKLIKEIAEEIYREWFVRLRFPESEKSEIVNGIPEGWEEKRFLDFGKVVIGKTPLTEKSEYYNGNIPFIKTPDFKQGLFLLNTEETLTVVGAQTQKNQYIEENSICVSCIGTVGEVIITTEKSQTNQQINTINLYDISHLEYLYFSIKKLKSLILAYSSTGATMGNLSKGKFEKIKLLMPNSIIINKFHKLCSPLFEEIKTLQQKNQNLKQTRDLLLPRLMSGKLDVENIEIL